MADNLEATHQDAVHSPAEASQPKPQPMPHPMDMTAQAQSSAYNHYQLPQNEMYALPRFGTYLSSL